MEWNEVCIKVNASDADTAAAVATMTVPYGIYIEDYSDMEAVLPTVGPVDYIDEALAAKDRAHAVVHIYIPSTLAPREAVSFIEERLTAESVWHEVTTSSIREEDWANNWKEFYHPERVGSRLVICPSWEEYARKEGDLVLDIDPGSSFGTGKHETTRLCLEALERLVHGGERVLDMGCGSGILGIASLLLGAQEALGVDIEKHAVLTAKENAANNGFTAPRYEAVCGFAPADAAFTESLGCGYDLILANIVADVILSMKSMFLEKLRDGGVLLVSGIIDTRADEVLDALAAAGFVLRDRFELRGWVAAAFSKR